jgi:hypothetical protein
MKIQILPGSEGEWGKREGVVGRGEKWPKQCMHIWINELKKNKEKNVNSNSIWLVNFAYKFETITMNPIET